MGKFIYILFFLFFLISINVISGYEIIDNKVKEETEKYYIDAVPHTLNHPGIAYFLAKSKDLGIEGDIDILIGTTDNVFVSKLEIYSNELIPTEISYSCNPPFWYNYSKNEFFCMNDNHVKLYADETNQTFIGWHNFSTLIFFHSYDKVDKNTNTFTWIEYKVEGWKDITKNNYEKKNYLHKGMDIWNIYKKIKMVKNQEILLRAYIDWPFNLKGKEGKYIVAFSPHNVDLGTSINNDLFFDLDPWYNESSFPYRFILKSNQTGTYRSILMNDTFGVSSFSNLTWILNSTNSNENVYLYCSNENCSTDWTVANESELRNYEKDYSMTGYNSNLAFDKDLLAVYHFNTELPEDSGRYNNDSKSSKYQSTRIKNDIGLLNKGLLTVNADQAYLEIPIELINRGNGSIEIWANGTTWATNYYALAGDTAGGNEELLMWYYGNGLKCAVDANYMNLNLTPSSEAWHHFVITWNTDTNIAFCYMDGIEVGSVKTAFGTPAVNNWTIGSWSTLDDQRAFSGTITEARFWSRALTQQEVIESYKNTIGNNLTRLESNFAEPTITILSPVNTTYYNVYNLLLNITNNTGVLPFDKFWFELNGIYNISIIESTTIKPKEGQNILKVYGNLTDNSLYSNSVVFTFKYACNSNNNNGTKCIDDFKIKCTDDNNDGIYNWSDNWTYCPGGCFEGECGEEIIKCVNNCRINQTICGGFKDKYIINCSQRNTGCYDWNNTDFTYCQYGCLNGRCLNGTNICRAEETQCFGNYIYKCGDDNSDGFMDWSQNKTFCQFGCFNQYNITSNRSIHYCNVHSFDEIYNARNILDSWQAYIKVIFPGILGTIIFLFFIMFVIYYVSKIASWQFGFIAGNAMFILGTIIGIVPIFITFIMGVFTIIILTARAKSDSNE